MSVDEASAAQLRERQWLERIAVSSHRERLRERMQAWVHDEVTAVDVVASCMMTRSQVEVVWFSPAGGAEGPNGRFSRWPAPDDVVDMVRGLRVTSTVRGVGTWLSLRARAGAGEPFEVWVSDAHEPVFDGVVPNAVEYQLEALRQLRAEHNIPAWWAQKLVTPPAA